MNALLHQADSRGRADYGWLKTRYTFSFADYHDRSRVHFGALRVLNDDWIKGGTGFDMHPHDNMEIITIIRNGELLHEDSMGHTEVLRSNDVQVMTAGTGIFHAERNNLSDHPVELFQIWIFPREKNLKPRYDQKGFDPGGRKNRWQTFASPGEDGTLLINQEAWLSMTSLEQGEDIIYRFHKEKQGAYLFVIEGSLSIGELNVNRRDGIGIMEPLEILINAQTDAEVLAIEIPMTS